MLFLNPLRKVSVCAPKAAWKYKPALGSRSPHINSCLLSVTVCFLCHLGSSIKQPDGWPTHSLEHNPFANLACPKKTFPCRPWHCISLNLRFRSEINTSSLHLP